MKRMCAKDLEDVFCECLKVPSRRNKITLFSIKEIKLVNRLIEF